MVKIHSLGFLACVCSKDLLEHDAILQVQVDVAEMVMQVENASVGDGGMSLSIDSDGDVEDNPPVPPLPTQPPDPCGNDVDPPPAACPPPNTTFKVCAMFGDPHLSESFKGRSYTEHDRGLQNIHTGGHRPMNHYGHGLYDIFKSSDGRIHAQGFFCGVGELAPLGNSLNMAVVKIGNNRIVWRRPLETLTAGPYNCDALPRNHDKYMHMWVNGYQIHHHDIPHTGFSNQWMWAEKLHLSKAHWPFAGKEQRNTCVGTHDRDVTIKMAVPPSACAWMPSMVIELAEHLVDYGPKSICSLEQKKSKKSAIDSVPWSESLFTLDELLPMCKGCQLMPAEDGSEVFAGCNPPPPEDFTGKQFCAQMGKTEDDWVSCNTTFPDDPEWWDACLVEVCTIGDEGVEETEDFANAGDNVLSTSEARLAGKYSVLFHLTLTSTQNMRNYQIIVDCFGSVTAATETDDDTAYVNTHIARELVPSKCKEQLQDDMSASMWIANTNVGLYGCVAEDERSAISDGTGLTLAGRFYDITGPDTVKSKKYFKYTMVDKYSCTGPEQMDPALKLLCAGYTDAGECAVCRNGYKLTSEKKCVKASTDFELPEQ